MDSYKGNADKNIYYNATGNVEVKVNEAVVDLSGVINTKFTDVFGPVPEGAGSNDPSGEKNVLIGDVNLAAGSNTITFKRTQTLNLSVKTFVIIGEDGCSHDFVADAGKTNVPATCETAGTNYLKCANCGETKEETVPALHHNMVEVSAEDLDAAHQLKTATCKEKGISGWKKCDREGCTHWESVEADYAAHDFDENGVCTLCGGVKVEYGASCALWSSNKQVKGSSQEFTVNVAAAGTYDLDMYMICSSGNGNKLIGVRGFTFKVGDGEAVEALYKDVAAKDAGMVEGKVSKITMAKVALAAGENKITIAIDSGADCRFSINDTSNFFVLVPNAVA